MKRMRSKRNQAFHIPVNALPRRTFLRGAGVMLGLPLLEAMQPVFGARGAAAAENEAPRRMLAICNNLGVLPGEFFPEGEGAGYTASPYLERLADHRDDFTVFSGVSHPSVDGSHSSDICYLTAAPHPANGGFRNSISLDQLMAERIGHLTRFPSLTLGVNVNVGQRSLSWTGSGVLIPCEESAAEVYKQLYLQGSEAEIERQVQKLRLGQSIMDTVAAQARTLNNKLGAHDRERVDQYVTGVRDLEKRMVLAQEWERKPKPAAPAPAPENPDDPSAYMEKVRAMYAVARMAFETDSTRLVTLMLDSVNSPTIDVDGVEVNDGYHNLSHHGKNEKKIAQLKGIDDYHMRLLDELFAGMKSRPEQAGTMLDHSMVLYGSNLGDASTHLTTNMPMLLAGGGFKHGQHLAFDRTRNYPLPNLYVSMLQRMGIETDRFASSTGTMRGLEMT